MVEAHDAPITLRQSEQRCDLLADADMVVSTIGVGSRRAWEQDVFVSRQSGIYFPIGATHDLTPSARKHVDRLVYCCRNKNGQRRGLFADPDDPG